MKKFLLSAIACFAISSAANAVVADKLWIIGDPAGEWNPTKGVECTKISDGVFEYVANFTAEKTSFGFVNQLAGEGDWDGLKAHRYVAPAAGTVPTVGENVMEYATSDAAWDLPAGNYTLTIDTNNMKLILGGDKPVVTAPKLYFLGEVNGWNPSDEYAFVTEDEGVTYTFKASMIRNGEDNPFKIATNGWSTEYSNGNLKMESGKTYPVVHSNSSTGNMGFAEDLKDAVLVLDTEKMTLTVSSSSSSAVTEIDTEENAEVEYYNLQGLRITEPKGLVIERKGSHTRKVIIK